MIVEKPREPRDGPPLTDGQVAKLVTRGRRLTEKAADLDRRQREVIDERSDIAITLWNAGYAARELARDWDVTVNALYSADEAKRRGGSGH